jgi:hypothetical protein
MKDGKKTTEFWLTLGSALFGVVVALGLFTPEQADQLLAAVQQVSEAVAGLILIVAPIWKYVKERTELKKLQ